MRVGNADRYNLGLVLFEVSREPQMAIYRNLSAVQEIFELIINVRVINAWSQLEVGYSLYLPGKA